MKISELQKTGVFIFGSGTTGQGLALFMDHHEIPHTLIDDIYQDNEFRLNNGNHLIGVVSPGWKNDHPLLQKAEDLNIKLISEIDFAWEMKKQIAPDQKWVAITGTNGKTTAVQMLDCILQNSDIKAAAGGNLGRTAIECLLANPPYQYLALELSSFQIEWSNICRFESSAILNIASDHLDYHGNFENYKNAKLRLFDLSAQKICNLDDEVLAEWFASDSSFANSIVTFSLSSPKAGQLGLVEEYLIDRAFVPDPAIAVECGNLMDFPFQGSHNYSNALAAIAIARSVGINEKVIASGLTNFQLDQHRLQNLGKHWGMNWIDDSKATNPHAAISALKNYENILWIVGGLTKGVSLDELMKVASKRVKLAVVIGKEQEAVITAIKEFAPNIKIVSMPNDYSGLDLMRLVVKKIIDLKLDGATVLLAPAAASMDQFLSYKERGEFFAQAILELEIPTQGEVDG